MVIPFEEITAQQCTGAEEANCCLRLLQMTPDAGGSLKKPEHPCDPCLFHVSSQQGFVLPMTLIVLALLTTLSMGLSQMARHAVADVQQRQLLLEQELAMKSSAQRALYYLLTGTPKARSVVAGDIELPVDGQWLSWGKVRISIQDEAGLMGLALYDQQAFEQLLANWLSQSDARSIAARLADWVDADRFARPWGMEIEDYLKASTAMLPRDAPLRSLDGLLELPGLNASLYNGHDDVPGLRDLLVVGSADFFNPATAPDILIGPMMGLSEEQEKQLIALKKKHDWASLRILFPDAPHREIDYHPGYVFEFRFRTGDVQGRAMYRLSPSRTVPYRLIMWQYPDHVRG